VNIPDRTPLRILIIDDNAEDRADARAALLRGSRRAHVFVDAASAEEGLRLLARGPRPDCILLDLGLPDADELEMLGRFPRDEDDLLLVPVVVLTGSVEIGLNQAALRAGAHDYVGKAWLRPETITQAVENAIERLRLARAIRCQRREADAVRQRARELEAENHQFQELSRLKSLFLANMSHELRTPLTAIIGFSDLLRSGNVPPASPQFAQFLEYIGVSGRHLLRMIGDVLDLSKVESGNLDFFPEPVDLPALVQEVSAILGAEIQRKRIRFAAEIDPGLVDLVLDPARLRQVLYNYLSNAVKFTPEAGAITLHARAHGAGQFRLEVADSGIGIAARDVPRLFTEYEQLDNGYAKQHQGAGLGLALTRRLVEAQGGAVGLTSVPGRGSVFWVQLARVCGVDPATAGPARQAPGDRWCTESASDRPIRPAR
jgi:signal transduction histidine kinase